MKSEANKLLVSTIKKLLHRRASQQLHKVIDRSHSADLAYAVNLLTKGERRVFFEFIEDVDKAAEIVNEVEPRVQSELLDMLTDAQILKLVGVWGADDTADILSSLEEERRELLLTMMQRDELATTQSLMGYDPETAGGLMVPEFFALEETTTAREAIAELQEDAGRTEMVFYLYVVNEHGHLVGVTSLRELVLARPERTLGEFMISEVVRVELETDQEEVARLIARYNLVALPVVDTNNHLSGVVTVDDIIDVIRSEATEDMMLMAGVGDEDVALASTIGAVRTRLPWLLAAAGGGLGAAVMIGFFEGELKMRAQLAAFIPIVMGLGGNIGVQASTIVVRGIAMGQLEAGKFLSALWHELKVVAIIAVICSTLVAGLSLTMSGAAVDMAGAGATSRLGVGTLGALLGAAVPMLSHRFGIDPAVATGPILTTAIDLFGVLIYFLIAKAWLGI